ncbi:MAG: type I DNA topoisomerase [Chloroflexi bacterium]|nr:type I DNA topoisomerase [Chloroflexota bacterium]
MGATEAHAGLAKPVVPAAEKKTGSKAKTKSAAKKTAKSATSKKKSASSKTTGAKTTSTGSAATAKKAAAAKTKPASKTAKSGSATAVRRSGKLVIVESPAKARSVGQYLGAGYTVKASKGHVRDLLVSQLSVDVENNFEPKYRVPNDKRDTVKDLKNAVDRAGEIFLATDPDREGEAIAWHLLAATDLDNGNGKLLPVQRVVFHEITKSAVQEAFQHPRELDLNLVNAQQARRILDRLVGYNITELLWEKVRNRLSAGRVQSIATRLIVDREREIQAFVPVEYWTLDARLRKMARNGKDDQAPFLARLIKIDGQDVAFGKEGDVRPHLAVLERSSYTVVEVKKGERQRKPSAPFTTSTLQQEASRRFGMNARRTMSIAQQLYEGIEIGPEGSVGLISYMRTDSTNVSAQAQVEARDYILNRFGKDYAPSTPPQYRTRAKGAQEAHEAIRPTGVSREPDSLRRFLSNDQYKLYTLIWQRFVASQMESAIYATLRVDIDGKAEPGTPIYLLRASGSTIKFRGFLALYEDSRDEDAAVDEDEGRILPVMKAGEQLDLLALLPKQHFTEPPHRYTEASLVRTLEEFGIGRPSTYAPTVAVIQDREYVVKEKDKRLRPTETGETVNDLLVQYFPEIMSYQFTAEMEDELDEISEGKREWRPMLRDFYSQFESQLKHAKSTIERQTADEFIGRDCPVCGKPLVMRYGRFGKFIGCSDYPNCRHTEPYLESLGVSCPVCGGEHGGEVVERRSRRGKVFYGCARYPDCQFTSWQRPLAIPCPNCGGLLTEQSRSSAKCINCGHVSRIDQLQEAEPA